ncbi:TetR/AcrR family transcriptional regulator [Roseomonas elaeocarpi]|uniref:TetR/AcrR family transcriptional regulator n=1 Tax=Roseomonas elaeocarpi TaxID=907779 RepID=A0ABV6JWI2_9PROT
MPAGAEKIEEGRDRRAEILRAAELLFAERGYAAVSIRDIAGAASVPIALVRYYFGRKEELFGFIFEAHRHLISERVEGIRAVGGPAGPARVERIVRAWAEPVLRERATEAANSFSVLVARSIWEADAVNRRIVEQYYDPLAHCFLAAMREALPGRDAASLVLAYEWSLGALLTFIADNRVERLSAGAVRAGDPQQAERLIRFIVAGFLASG